MVSNTKTIFLFNSLILSYDFSKLEKDNDFEAHRASKRRLLLAINESFESLGINLSLKSLNKLSVYTAESLKTFYHEMFDFLCSQTHANFKGRVFYKNFPNLKNFSEEDYILRAMLHYMTVTTDSYGLIFDDSEPIKKKGKEKVKINVKVFELFSKEESDKYISNTIHSLITNNKAISTNLYRLIYENFDLEETSKYLGEITFKDTYFLLLRFCLFKRYYENEMTMTPEDYMEYATIFLTPLKGVKDVISVYLHICEFKRFTSYEKYKNLSMDNAFQKVFVDKYYPTNVLTKFYPFSRKMRKLFLQKIEKDCINSSIYSDLNSSYGLYMRFFDCLHIGEYRNLVPQTFAVVDNMRDKNFATFFSKVEEYFKNKDYDNLIGLLSVKPGYFARSIDRIFLTFKNKTEATLKALEDVSDNISNNVLLQLLTFYNNRNLALGKEKLRYTATEKGEYFLNDKYKREDMSSKQLSIVIDGLTSILENKFGKREQIKVFFDDSIKEYAIPFNEINKNFGIKSYTLGSRIPLKSESKNFDTIRLFTHWKNIDSSDEDSDYDHYDSRVDIDLSAHFVSEDFSTYEHVNWTRLGSMNKYDVFHSGDVTSAPKGAEEYIDINVKKARADFRYVVINNIVYTGQPFGNIPECMSGAMLRKGHGLKGEIFDPRTVVNSIRLASSFESNVAFIIDLKTMEMIWVDSPSHYGRGSVYSVDGNSLGLLYKSLRKNLTMYDLLMLHKKHITFVKNKKDIDENTIVFGTMENSTLTPYNVPEVIKQFIN